MRAFPLLALALLIASPPTAGLSPLLLPGAEDGGGASTGATAEPARESPFILVEIRNDGAAARVTVEAYRLQESGEPAYSREVTVPADSLVEHVVPLGEDEYMVGIRYGGSSGLFGQSFTLVGADTRGCPGAYVAAFFVEDERGGDHPSRHGCLVAPRGFNALRAEAEEGLRTPQRSAGISVPAPGSGDEGEFLEWSRLRAPEWGQASWTRFRWSADVAFPDAWGREVRGPELTYVREHETYARGMSALTGGVPLQDQEVNTSGLPRVLRFQPGESEALARTLGFAGGAAVDSLQSSGHYLQALVYEPQELGADCLFRFRLQGEGIREGARYPASMLCVPGVSGDKAEWVAGRVQEHRGFRAIPIYLVHTDEVGILAARAWLANGVPYPLDVEWMLAPAGCCADHRAYRLEKLQGRGEPLASVPTGDASPAPSPDLDPLDPLEGPALSEAARRRFPFPLDEASHAARSDPTLGALRDLLRAPDAALAGAVLRVRQDAGPAGPGTHVWHLLFVAPGPQPVRVDCERPATPISTGIPVSAPLARCEVAERVPAWAEEIAEAPGIGAADLPATAASFDLALERWAASDPGRGRSGAITHAVYRPWPATSPTAWPEPALVVGAHFPFTDDARPAFSSEDEASHTRVHLTDGRSVAEVRGASRTSGLGNLPAGIAPDGRGTVAPAAGTPALPGWHAPAIAGLGVAAVAGLLATLWYFGSALKGAILALYSRLTRGDVLGQDVRARIHAIVQNEPGIHARAIQEHLGAGGNGLTEYHLGILVREGFLSSVETPGFRRYFIAGRFSPAEMRVIAALKSAQAEKVFRIIQTHPGIRLSEVAEKAGLTRPHTSRTVKKLAEAGLVDRVREGRAVSLYTLEK